MTSNFLEDKLWIKIICVDFFMILFNSVDFSADKVVKLPEQIFCRLLRLVQVCDPETDAFRMSYLLAVVIPM